MEINHEIAERQSDLHASPKQRHRIWRWVGWAAIFSLAALVFAAEVVIHRAEPILKGRVVEALSDRFNSHVELDDMRVSLLRGLEVSGSGLRIFAPDEVVAAGATSPLIAVRTFQFHAGLLGLFVKPMHVGLVHVQGLAIHIPPRRERGAAKQPGTAVTPRHRYNIKIVADAIVCDDSQLVIGTDKPNKDPKVFQLKHIVLRDVGPSAPWPYDATLINAIPRGDIHASGTFGPWQTESPGDSSVTGSYTFDHADLGTIKGIGGTLSSVGTFAGKLNKIQAQGTADVPDFSLDTARHPMPLHTRFTVEVNGLTGDTYLQPVEAVLGRSAFTCRGAVVNVKGVGHTIDLDIDVRHGRIQDFLQLAVKTDPVVMTGVIETKTKLHIRAGKESVGQKLSLNGQFRLDAIDFTRAAVQQKVDMLSARAQGHPREANQNAPEVGGAITGAFTMNAGELNFPVLHYSIPGANVELQGFYTLDGRRFDFTGTVRTKARLSQMVKPGWKSLLLKAADPFFAKNGAGVEVPIKISGVNGEPKFGLDFGRKNDRLHRYSH